MTPNGRGDSSSGYPFTHPIASADPAEEPRLAAALMRRVLIVLHAMGSLQLLAVLALPDPNTSDHGWILGVSVASALVAIAWTLVRRPPDWLLLVGPVSGTILVTTVVATADPLSGTPFFYIWTTLVTSYFLQRREAAIHIGLVAVAFAVALAAFAEPDARVMMFLDTMVPAVTVAVLVVLLKERVWQLVGRLNVAATTDPLTGLLNRRAFDSGLRSEVARTLRDGAPTGLLILDIDHFKSINDRHGHPAGDHVLRQVAGVLRDHSREYDVVARIGGEEFGVLLPGASEPSAHDYAERLRLRLAQVPVPGGDALSVSVGVSAVQDYGDGETLVRLADRALYAAKAAGRNCVVCASGLAPVSL